MKISGFSFARNADSLYYPVVESIRSILPICDEFIIAIGKGSEGDATRELVAQIGDPKICIIDTEWPESNTISEHVFRQQTDIALKACTGDWCFYIQSDEAVHERYLPGILARIHEVHNDPCINGLLFRFKHFWGDYDHHQVNHKWYPREIRIIRNNQNITSWGDAQSFRQNGLKIGVTSVDAEVFHYGWVRPPQLMQKKRVAFTAARKGETQAQQIHVSEKSAFDYGPLHKLAVFTDTHPAVMQNWIARINWKHELDYKGISKTRFGHDRLKYRILTFIEQKLCGGRQVGGYQNFKYVKR